MKNEVKEWNFTLKLMIAELNGDKSHNKVLSERLGYLSAAESREKSDLNLLTLDENEDNQDEEIDDGKKDEKKEENNQKQAEEPAPKSSPKFEIISHDSNTEYKFLDNLNYDESNDLSEQELKSTVFNAYKTIDNLQNDLM